MPLTFAGIDLTPSAAGHERAAAYWHSHTIEEWEHQAYLVPRIQHLPAPYPPTRQPPRIGVLHWPVSASKWGVCHLVATGEQIATIRTVIGTAPTAQSLVIDDGYGGSVSTQMYLLPPRPIAQRGVNEWYLLTLVDERWWWYQAGDARLSSDPASWTALLTALFTQIGVTPSVGTIPSAYSTPNPSRWNIGPQPVPLVIDAVCNQIGMRCVRKLDGTVSVVPYATATSDDASRWATIENLVLAGGRLVGADLGRAAPASVDTVFFDDTVVNKTLTGLALSDYGGVVGVADRIGRITADLTPDSVADKDAYATQAATDYYNWFLALTDVTLRAIQNVDPVGLDGHLEWVRSMAGDYVTRIVRPEWSDRNIYGEAYPSADATGDAPEYQDECINGTLVRKRAVISLTADGLSQTTYIYEQNLGVLCTGGITGSGLTGSGAPSPIPPQAGDVLAVVELACPIYGSIRTVAIDYTVVWDDDIIHADATGAALTITLPAPTAREPGSDRFIVKKIDGSANTVTIESVSGNIEFAASNVLSTQGKTSVLYHDGIDWFLESRIT